MDLNIEIYFMNICHYFDMENYSEQVEQLLFLQNTWKFIFLIWMKTEIKTPESIPSLLYKTISYERTDKPYQFCPKFYYLLKTICWSIHQWMAHNIFICRKYYFLFIFIFFQLCLAAWFSITTNQQRKGGNFSPFTNYLFDKYLKQAKSSPPWK